MEKIHRMQAGAFVQMMGAAGLLRRTGLSGKYTTGKKSIFWLGLPVIFHADPAMPKCVPKLACTSSEAENG